jgi:hypothetical protein
MKIQFLQECPINGVTYQKGDVLNVSMSIYNRVISGGYATDLKDEAAKEDVKEDVEVAEKPKKVSKK